MANSRSRFQARSRRRLTAWEEGAEAQGQSVSSSTPLIGTLGLQLVAPAATLIRIRGFVTLTLNATSIALGGFRGAMGLGIASEEAFAAGQASLRTPLGDDGWDGWMWHQYFSLKTVTATIGDAVNAVTNVQRFEIDSKSMRKMVEGDTLYFSLAGTEAGVAVMHVDMICRTLFKLA